MSTIAILGAGSRGTALAQVFADTHHQVILRSPVDTDVNAINTQHTNPRYCDGHILSPAITATTDATYALASAERVVIALPSRVVEPVLQELKTPLKGKTIILATKGLFSKDQLFFSELITQELETKNLMILSGPSHAEEVIQRKTTKVALASQQQHLLHQAAFLFPPEYFQLDYTDDVKGLQIGGATKNIIALAAGMSDGGGSGINAKAALLTQGIKEMKQFAALYGGRAETIEGLAGLGDLLVTAMSPLSRNRQAGTYLAQGYPKEQIVHELMRMEVESFNVLEKLSLPQKADQYFPLLSTVQNIYRGNISKEEIPIALAFLV